MEKPTFESPEEKKRKKAEKDSVENQSRFERIQAALRRAMESLLDPPKNDGESKLAKEPQRKAARRERSRDVERGSQAAEPETPARPEHLTTADAEVLTPRRPEAREVEVSVPQSPDELTSARESSSSTATSESRTAALRERADQIWQQARGAVRNFIDRSRITNAAETETTDEASSEVGGVERETDTTSVDSSLRAFEVASEHESTTSREDISNLTITELEDRFGKHTADYQRETVIETNDSAGPIVPLYVAFNELRQRRYRKKLERIADEQRKQQQSIDQVERDSRRQSETVSSVQPTAVSQPILKRKNHESVETHKLQQQNKPQQAAAEQPSQPAIEHSQAETREGEVRVSYPPVAASRLEQTHIKTEPTAETLTVDESEAEKQRISRERSQPAVAIKEVVEDHPAARIEQAKSNPESTITRASWEQRTGSRGSRIADRSTSASVSATPSKQTHVSDDSSTAASAQQGGVRRTDTVIDTPRWQQAVLIVINLLLIALLVRELVS